MNATKEHILLTAFRLFVQKGYKEVTMSMLVKATGLSKGAFYHYFENKEQLFIETLDNLFFSYSPFNREMVINPEVSFYDYMKMYIDNVSKMADMMQNYLGENSSGMDYYRFMIDVFTYAPDFYKKIELSNQYEMNFWSKALENGKSKGELKKDLDIELMACQFQWLQDGVAMNSLFSGTPDVLMNRLEGLFNQLYKLIKE